MAPAPFDLAMLTIRSRSHLCIGCVVARSCQTMAMSKPGIVIPPPRSFAENVYNIVRWSDMPRGGHFAAMEEPALFVDDVRAWAARARLTAAEALECLPRASPAHSALGHMAQNARTGAHQVMPVSTAAQ